MQMKKVLGIGNALVDIITFLENDAVLRSFALPAGSMQLIDAGKALRLDEATRHCRKHKSSGGSAANTIHGLAQLGIETGFIGTVGRDAMGDFFRDDLLQAGIRPLLSESPSDTGRSQALVTPDGERTMATYLGAAVELSADRLKSELFDGYAHLHLEGYLVLNQDLVESALDLARQHNMTVSLDRASFNVVEENLDFLHRITRDAIQIVFANEEEARAFTGVSDPGRALDQLSVLCDTAVVKIGEKGSLIRQGGRTTRVEPLKVDCLDTTGAGDLYAAGFLYGFVHGFEVEKSGNIGSLLAGKVIEVPGAKISQESWVTILSQIRSL
jgi:sugar/nucleoside kinase (ribokinase family)